MLVFASVNAFIPASFKVERYAELDLSEKRLYNYLRDVNQAYSWNPWLGRGNFLSEIDGDEGDKGSTVRFTENEKMICNLELAYIKPTNDVRYAIEIDVHPEIQSLYFLVERQENGYSKIIAGLKGQRSFPLRIINLMMDKRVGPELELMLNRINSHLTQSQ